MGLDWRPGRHSPGVQSPAFAKRGAVADFDRDAATASIQFCPERIGFVEHDRILSLIMRSEHVHRLTRSKHAIAHVALLARMVSGSKNFFEHLGPIPYRLTIHLQNDMLNNCWSDAFVGEGKSNGTIAAIEFENWPDGRPHLLPLHVSGVTGNAHSE